MRVRMGGEDQEKKAEEEKDDEDCKGVGHLSQAIFHKPFGGMAG